MAQIFYRIIFAVLCVVLLFAALPLLFSIIGFPLAGNVFALLRICIAAIAIFYVFAGPPLGWPKP